MFKEKLLWTNWKEFQVLATNPYQQVSNELSKIILNAGFTWAPVMDLNSPITLTPISQESSSLKEGLKKLINLGFQFEATKEEEASFDNAFNVDVILKNVWGALGITQPYLDIKK